MSNHPEDTAVYVENTDPEARQKQPPSNIHGWGADLDPRARPAVPMERTPPRFIEPHYEQPEQQPVTVKVFHSTERPGLTPVVGTSPLVGFSPTMLLNAAGTRPEPAVSVPSAKLTSPAPTATPEPELDPPGIKAESNGLRATP